MTNEEAIRMLVRIKERINFEVTDAQEKMDALNMGIKALEQQPCEDTISRKDMLAIFRQSNSLSQAWNGFEKLPSVTPKQQPCEDAVSRGAVKAYAYHRTMYPNFEDYVDKLPPVTPKEKTAAWVPTDEEPHEVYECNACGWLLYDIDRIDFKYCPNCGARMVSE